MPAASLCTASTAILLAEHERAPRTSNRNFRGRQGRNGRTHRLRHPGGSLISARGCHPGPLTDVRKLLLVR